MIRIRVATRASPLALWQAEAVKKTLLGVRPDVEVEIVSVRTLGDRNTRADLNNLEATGVFTKEVDREIVEGRADVAVHSLKDQETTLPNGVVLGMVLPRGPVEDVLVSRAGERFEDLPPGARIATGSLRRRAQLLRLRDDVTMVGIRGNVDARLRKLREGAADALVMARAGLERLGLGGEITQVFDLEAVLSAPAQGIVGVTCRQDDDVVREVLRCADDATTHVVARAERALLRTLHGGCNVPLGALARPEGSGKLRLVARVLGADGSKALHHERTGPAGEPEALGEGLAAVLLQAGARDLIEELRP